MSTTPATFADVAGPSPETLIAGGFLASYREPTRSHYAMIVKQWYAWCADKGFRPMEAQRPHFELWMREMEEVQKLKPSTICGKVGCISQLYKYAVIDGYLPASPCQWIKRPPVQRMSTTNGLSRPELLRVLDLAKASGPQDHAIMCILGLNGLRVGELCAITVEDIGREGGYHTIKIVREKSHEPAVIPLSPRTSWAVEQTMWGRHSGPLFMLRGEVPIDRRGVDRIVKRLAKQAGITKRVSPHSLRHTFITLALDAGVNVRNVRNSVGHSDDRMVAYYDRNRESLTLNATHMVSAFVEG